MSQGNMLLENTVLYGMLGADGIDVLKRKLIDMIVEEVREQLHDAREYIIAPDDIASELCEEVTQEVIEQVKDEYREQIMKALAGKLGNL